MYKKALLLCAATVCLAAAPPKSFTGVITDEMCGNDHKMMNVTPDTKCVADCVKAGSKYVLLSETKIYKLSDQTAPAKFPGQKVKVTGTLAGDTITVKSVEAAK
jgi:hypothetical protein